VVNKSFRLVSVFLAIFFVHVGFAESKRGTRPNLIFLLTDDQRWDTLGAYGNNLIHTPVLDGLAAKGVVFENMFVTTSICASSRASILTGQYVGRHGIWDFRTKLTEEQLSRTYLGVLKEAGYKVGFIGKWGVGNPPEDFFDFDRTFPGQGNYFVQVDGETRHLTSVMADQAVQFIDSVESNTPFCLSVSFKAAHVQDSYDLGKAPFPFDQNLGHLYGDVEIPPPATSLGSFFENLPLFLQDSENRMRWAVRFWGPKRYQESIKGYYRLISGVDLAVGKILESLTRHQLTNQTIIVFTGDNGFFLGELGLAGKWLPHDVSIRVPLVIYDPSLPASRREELALNIDLAPTLLELAGLDPPKEMQGRSLLKLMKNDSESWRTEFFYEHHFKHPRIPPTEAVRTASLKYIRYLESEPLYEELYDLTDDPDETKNLANKPEYYSQLKQMRSRWRRLREESQ
jgi:arylsulfatase A-like enzyme